MITAQRLNPRPLLIEDDADRIALLRRPVASMPYVLTKALSGGQFVGTANRIGQRVADIMLMRFTP